MGFKPRRLQLDVTLRRYGTVASFWVLVWALSVLWPYVSWPMQMLEYV